MRNQSSAFPDLDVTKINRINLQRQTPGQRGPGSLVHSALPSYTEHEELVGLCEQTGPGRYKAVALCDRGRPLGPTWSYEVADTSPAASPFTHRSVAGDDELRQLRAAHQSELDELKARLEGRFAAQLEQELKASERALEARIEFAGLEAQRRIDAAERAAKAAVDEVDAVRRRKDEDIDRLRHRLESITEESAALGRRYNETRERISEIEAKGVDERLRYMERIQALEAELSASKRVHEAEMRELRHGSPEVHALIAKNTVGWDIERQRTLLAAELEERASANSLLSRSMEALKNPEVQQVLGPVVEWLFTEILAKRGAANGSTSSSE